MAQVYFKYCSTFDSTPRGNIGPVTDALLDALHGPGQGFTIACPAFPENRRTVFQGHLFVGEQLLSDSGMRHHPLTPMTDANLVRVLQAQTRRRVGLVAHEVVARGSQAIRERFAVLQAQGVQQMAIGPQIDPGVPWTAVHPSQCPGQVLHLALKSGNFGGTDFFAKAFAVLA